MVDTALRTRSKASCRAEGPPDARLTSSSTLAKCPLAWPTRLRIAARPPAPSCCPIERPFVSVEQANANAAKAKAAKLTHPTKIIFPN